MTDAELKAILNRGGIASCLYEGDDVAEANMATWRKLADTFKDYYDLQEYNKQKAISDEPNA